MLRYPYGVNDTLNFDWVSGVKRDIHFLNTGYTTAGGQGGVDPIVGTTNGRRITGFFKCRWWQCKFTYCFCSKSIKIIIF